jgi:hypothetical protein
MELGAICSHCGKDLKTLSGEEGCTRCGVVRYCCGKCKISHMRIHARECYFHTRMGGERKLLDTFFSWVLKVQDLKKQALVFSRKVFKTTGMRGLVMLVFHDPERMKVVMAEGRTKDLVFEYFFIDESQEKYFLNTESPGTVKTWINLKKYNPDSEVFFGVLLGNEPQTLTNMCVF